jgi:hypothetical protein
VIPPELIMGGDAERVISIALYPRSLFTERAERAIKDESRPIGLYRWLRSLGVSALEARERLHYWRRKKAGIT